MYLYNPKNFKNTVSYDPVTKKFIFSENIGSFKYKNPMSLSLDEYREYDFKKSTEYYWIEKAKSNTGKAGSKGLNIKLPSIAGKIVEGIFGSDKIEIKPQGSAELIFGLNISKTENPLVPEKLRTTTVFNFDQKIQMNVTGKIGDKIELGTTYNTEAMFDFDNKMKLAYEGKEDEIIQKIEAGNVSLALPGSLITGSQSLFGIRADLKFGHLSISSIVSQQKGEKKEITLENGAQYSEYEITADEYDADRHFFLSQFFKDKYDEALVNSPTINSQITITKIEVWVSNSERKIENSRNLAAFTDLGESDTNIFSSLISDISPLFIPFNKGNSLYDNLTATDIRNTPSNSITTAFDKTIFASGQDYEVFENAKQLSTSEFTFHPQLGYISLNSRLRSDQKLAVAFEFIYNGQTYQVGEFASDGVVDPQYLIVKLIQATAKSPQLPTWDLMMKNVYSLNAYDLTSEDFILDIFYEYQGKVINYLPNSGNIDGQMLLKVLNLDNINFQSNPVPDGVFDYINGITIRNSKIFFPIREPFGSHLKEAIGVDTIAEKYVYQELYDKTLTEAKQAAEKNKFLIKGKYKGGSSSEIYLNAFNIPRGSVKVTAGGQQLVENQDYTVDYNMGRVKILNEGLLESGRSINVSLESNSMFSIQSKTLLGTRLDYKISENFNIGGTVMNLHEKPITKKVSIGEEAISNTIWGLDLSYNTETPILTKAVDFLPFIETKEKSFIDVQAEFAHFLPGNARALGKDGQAYIDDFEGAKSSFSIKPYIAWHLSTTPQKQINEFPEGELINDLSNGFNRAKFAWFRIDPYIYLRDNANKKIDDRKNHLVREVSELEIFKERELQSGDPGILQTLDLSFYPTERGPYNYDTESTIYSSGLDINGNLKDPKTRWAGIMRNLPITDFNESNVEYIEFWLMDPFVYDDGSHQGGQFYINLGDISEDILRDDNKNFEDGLPSSSTVEMVDTSVWGRYTIKKTMINAFETEESAKEFQDIGIDGLSSRDESSFFSNYINWININTNADYSSDPSNDDFIHYNTYGTPSSPEELIEFHKNFNGMESNSTGDVYNIAHIYPDAENINRDYEMQKDENYYQYKIEINPTILQKENVGTNFITDYVSGNTDDNGNTVGWFQFRIPINEYDSVFGIKDDFSSIRFMRMYLKGFEEPMRMRFATLDLVRGEWRQYANVINYENNDISDNSTFEVGALNLEENSQRTPVNYVLPPDIDREIDPSNPQLLQLNEQSLLLKVENLKDGYSRATYRNFGLDFRKYKRFKMDAHAESIDDLNGELQNDELSVFIRIGNDYTENYYEYEIPLKVTPHGNYDNDDSDDRYAVWPLANKFDFPFSVFQEIKKQRNVAMQKDNTAANYNIVYESSDGNNKVRMLGNPTISKVKTIMIGVRNPEDATATDKSGIIWVNEMKLTEIDKEGGWAARTNVSAKLADFGNLNASASYRSPNFGSLEKTINEIDKEETKQYDLASTFELGKFFPKKYGVSLPLYTDFAQTYITPQYNPLDPDLLLKDYLDDLDSKRERDSIKKIVLDFQQRKSFNLANVRIAPTNIKKLKPWSISNFAITYSFSEILARNINTEYDIKTNHRFAFSYNYNLKPKNYKPFNKVKLFRKKSLKFIKDFNFYLMPSRYSFKSDINRRVSEYKVRNIENPSMIIKPNIQNNFTWDRFHELKFDLTRSIKFSFTSSNREIIDYTQENWFADTTDHFLKKERFLHDILQPMSTENYHHNIEASYNVPLNKFPLVNWISLNLKYSGRYDWEAGQITREDSLYLGNTIKNLNTKSINIRGNFTKLYSKVKYLKEIDKKFKTKKRGGKKKKEYKDVNFEKVYNFKKKRSKTITHNLKVDKITKIEIIDENGKKFIPDYDIIDKNKIKIKRFEETIKGAKLVITAKKEIKDNPLKIITDNILHVLMGVKNVSVNISENTSTIAPGFMPKTKVFGMENRNSVWAPGLSFISGWEQDISFLEKAKENGWLLDNPYIVNPFITNKNSTINIRATVEPINDLRIDITGTSTKFKTQDIYYDNDLEFSQPFEKGSFSTSFLSIKTFQTLGKNLDSRAFDNFMDYREIISRRLTDRNPNTLADNDTIINGYTYSKEYSQNQQEVIIYAFKAAYLDQDPKKSNLSLFNKIPFPNWRITYNGLIKKKFFKKHFKNFSIAHAYTSKFNVASFVGNPDYTETDGFSSVSNELSEDLLPKYEIATITLMESFSPLIKIDMVWQNSVISKFEIKKSRNIVLNFANSQMIENTTNDFIIGGGYTLRDVAFGIKVGGKKQNIKSDLNIRFDFSFKINRGVVRNLETNVYEEMPGKRSIGFKLSADYNISQKFQLRFFFDRNENTPFKTQSFRRVNTSVGFSVRFSLT